MENENVCALEIFNHNSQLPLLSAEKKVFENSLNTSGDIAFLPGQCKGENWNFYIFGSCNVAIGKVVTLLLENENVCALEIFNHNSQLPLLSAKKKFLKIR